jgi:nicotinamide mononucleotide transporter
MVATNAYSRLESYFDDWTAFEKVWLSLFTLIGFIVWNTWNGTVIGLVALLTGMITVVLVAKGDIWNYAFGVVNVLLYGWIAWQSNLYGEVMLNWLFYLPLQGIGFYLWSQNMDDGVVNVKSFSIRQRIGIYVGSVGAIGLYGLFLKWLNGNLPFVDATSTVLSVIAQLLMVARSKDQWPIWMLINAVSIYIWVKTYIRTGAGVNMITMWTSYLVNSVYGWWKWNKMEG